MNPRWLIAIGLLILTSAPLLAHPASPPPLPSVFLEDLTWTELRSAIASGNTTVLIPIGGTEQSGPGLALGKHNARVTALSGRIAQELGNALVAPVIAYVPEGPVNPPTSHMRFPGTITVTDAAFSTTLEFAARSMKQAGFQNVVFLGDHGGYQQIETAVAAKLSREWIGSPVRVIALTEYYRASTDGFAAILKARGFSADEIGKHAGLSDTSLQMALAPNMVRADRLVSSRDGVEGDPRRASVELGQLGVNEIVSASVAAVRKYTARP